MGSGTFVLVLALFVLSNLAAAQDNIDEKRADQLANKVDDTTLLKPKPNQETWDTVASQVAARGGCDPNVCFALDGSASIPFADYELQKNFVQLIVAIVGADPRAAFAAAQYGIELEVIKKLNTNAAGFLNSVSQSTFLRARNTFIEPGLVFCISQLGQVAGEPAKLVLLGDGRSNVFDIDNSALVAKQFRDANPANEICAVGVGFQDISGLTKIVGNSNRVLQVTDWPTVLNILDALVEEICGKLPPPPPPTKPPTTKPPTTCPCKCTAAASSRSRDVRRAFRKVRRECRPFRPRCSVEDCPGSSPPAFKCC